MTWNGPTVRPPPIETPSSSWWPIITRRSGGWFFVCWDGATGFAASKQQPTSEAVRAFLASAIHTAGTAPKYPVAGGGRNKLLSRGAIAHIRYSTHIW
jgi:hypothetical protein